MLTHVAYQQIRRTTNSSLKETKRYQPIKLPQLQALQWQVDVYGLISYKSYYKQEAIVPHPLQP